MRGLRLLTLAMLMGTLLAGCLEPGPDTGLSDDTIIGEPADPDWLELPMDAATGNLSELDGPVIAVPHEPTLNQTYTILLGADETGLWRLGTQDWTLDVSTRTGIQQITAPAHREARSIEMQWNFTSESGTTSGGMLAFDIWGVPLEFSSEPEDGQILRPGIRSEGCTTNFLFQYKWQRIFIGTAAHCIDGSDAESGDCSETESKIGDNETLEGDIQVTHAYSSWTTANRVGDCIDGNDFGLFEVAPDDWPLLHPRSHGIVGDVHGLGDCREMTQDLGSLSVVAYGRSSLRSAAHMISEPDRPVDDKRGEFLESTNEGYQCHVYLVTPGIPGDSGGPLATADGLALGAASTVTLAPTTGSNHYTNIQAALEFMQEHEGWAPELIPSAIESETNRATA